MATYEKKEHPPCKNCGQPVEAINSFTCDNCKALAKEEKEPILKLWHKFLYT